MGFSAVMTPVRSFLALDLVNSRELATVIWVVLVFVACLLVKPVRASLVKVAQTLAGPPLLETLVVLVMYVVLLAWIGHALGIWTTDLISETVWWFVGTAIVLLFNVTIAVGERGFFLRTLLEVFGFTLLLDFFMNDLFVFALPIELVLLAAITFLGLLTIVAGRDPTTRQVASATGCLMAFAGLGVAGFVIFNVVTNWSQVTTREHVLELLLPAWLTVGFLPFVYVISVLVAYESAFTRIKWSLRDRKVLVWKVQLALVSVLGGRARYAGRFTGGWIDDAASAGSFQGMRTVIKEFKRSIERSDRAASEESDRLVRYAGVSGTDSQGLQLDRREFLETRKALRDLATAQMGWYHHPGQRYRADLIDVFVPIFRNIGLPESHGIVMRVARDGQAWYAWRRTVTGWCFAIGASAPPPDQWEFDGPQPPSDFPGTDPAWGSGPFRSEVNANWDDPAADPDA
jgi:hypothetical protein